MKNRGVVYLVGAGPGDPGLITIKAVECLRKADVVAYDYLANKSFLDYARPAAEKIYVGKKGAFHSREQVQINQLLIDRAGKGKTVVRLKGGDPFVFGRGGEEAEALAEVGVPFEVVPGVTSAIAVPAYAGIPMTHRDFTPAVAIVTGHEKDSQGAHGPDWVALSRMGTIVFLMGYGNLPRIVKNLTDAGMDPLTPAAVIQWGTLPRQKTVLGTLETIAKEVDRIGIKPPTIIVVGKVVTLSKKLGWFERKPLFGKRILVTRSPERAGLLAQALREAGAEVIEIPTIEIMPPKSFAKLDRAVRSVSKYHWIVFASVNAVDHFFRRLRQKGEDLRELQGVRIAVVGPATKRAVEDRGLKADLVARRSSAEGLVQALRRKGVSGKKILIPRSRLGREDLVEGLEKLKARVEAVEAYRPVLPEGRREDLNGLIEKGNIDGVIFASPSAVENFQKMAGRILPELPVVCIGPTTAKRAREAGFSAVSMASRPTVEALVSSLLKSFR